ncbi:MAG TPA: ATP-binding protein [Clostridiales bacterium]|nr:ATP-binding protein [Clostridiales bacterium]
MRELALHILDIAQNSISAKATLIKIEIEEYTAKNLIQIRIIDNGIGMSKELLEKVTDPFITTRKTRKVGLGISLFKAAAERCGGHFEIRSEIGEGTEVCATFERDHIDRAPLGNMPDTMVSLITANDQIDYLYRHVFDDKEFVFDTKEIRKILGEVPLSNIQVIDWIHHYIKDGLKGLGISF